MKSFPKKSRGFSLIEILVVIAMLGVIMGAVYSLLITNQRAAYTSDETVEVQQNLRIAMESISKDLRMAGMLVPLDTTGTDATQRPINALTNDAGVKILNTPACPTCDANPAALGSDTVTLNMLSASGVYARVTADVTPATTPTLAVAPAVGADQASDGELFAVGDRVSLVRPFDLSVQNAATYQVQATTNNSLTFTATIAEELRVGDMIAKVNNQPGGLGATPYPNTVLYAVVSNGPAATAAADPNCPIDQLCLTRLANGDALANRQIVAQNIADFQLRYVLDDNSVVDNPNPSQLPQVRSIMVTLWGETRATRLLSSGAPKIRQLSSVIKLRNRR